MKFIKTKSKTLVRRFSLLLTLLLASQTMASCGSTETKKPDNTGTPGESSVETEETEAAVTDDLGDLRFDGKEFHIYLAHPMNYIAQDEETGDPLDDAVYKRNRNTEERLGIKLVITKGIGDTTGTGQTLETQTIRSFVLSGDDTNDIYIHVQHTGMPGLITEGCFVDWNTVPNINFDKPYWYSNCIRDINYGSKVFAMSGMYNLNILTSSNLLMFNKRIFDETQIDYPYQQVLDGTWTFDKFSEMVKSGTRDLNGDTKIGTENDQLGFWGWGYEEIPALFIGLGGDVLTKDNNNMPVISIDTERNNQIVDSILGLFKQEGAKYELTTYGGFNTLFKSGKLMFLHASISSATQYRDMVDDFGFVPYPKLDEKQENYAIRIQNTAGLTYIPVTNKGDNLAMTGAVLEVMSALSYNTVVPAFFDVALTVKSTRDSESEQMIPIINSNAAFYDEATEFSMISTVSQGKALSTAYAEVKNKVEDNVAKIIETYK